jgi:hypothetical protein
MIKPKAATAAVNTRAFILLSLPWLVCCDRNGHEHFILPTLISLHRNCEKRLVIFQKAGSLENPFPLFSR